MSTDNRRPLESTTSGNIPKRTIEETYRKLTLVEHILRRPETYIGSIVKQDQTLWVWENDEMIRKPISYVPGLYRIFDEILVNAADNKKRDPNMDTLKVDINVEENIISVYNNGRGVPVEVHPEEGSYVPELIFGYLSTSGHYGGWNGYGAKLANIFSTEFTVETVDGERNKRYKQVFTNNMGKKSEPTITECNTSDENWTRVSFKPDLEKFGMVYLEDDVVALMKKRVVDLAGCLGEGVEVFLDGKCVHMKCFKDYVKLYLGSSKSIRIYEIVNDNWEICISMADGQFEQVSFVNNIATSKGGTHVDYITDQVANHVVDAVKKKYKHANLEADNVKDYLWVFVNALIDNPAFDSKTKETLITKESRFGSTCKLTPEFLEKIEDFFHLRLDFYEKRKDDEIAELDDVIAQLDDAIVVLEDLLAVSPDATKIRDIRIVVALITEELEYLDKEGEEDNAAAAAKSPARATKIRDIKRRLRLINEELEHLGKEGEEDDYVVSDSDEAATDDSDFDEMNE